MSIDESVEICRKAARLCDALNQLFWTTDKGRLSYYYNDQQQPEWVFIGVRAPFPEGRLLFSISTGSLDKAIEVTEQATCEFKVFTLRDVEWLWAQENIVFVAPIGVREFLHSCRLEQRS